MSTAPTIITGPVHETLANMPSDSVDAVVTMVPVNKVNRVPRRKHSSEGAPRPLNTRDLDDITLDLLRVTRGAIVLLTIHGAKDWAASFARHGADVQRHTQEHDLVEIIALHKQGRTVTLPAEAQPLSPLIRALVNNVTQPGDIILDPFAVTPLVPLVAYAGGRRLTAITTSGTQERSLSDALTAKKPRLSLTEEEGAEIIRRLEAGESRASIANSMGIRNGNITTMLRRTGKMDTLNRSAA